MCIQRRNVHMIYLKTKVEELGALVKEKLEAVENFKVGASVVGAAAVVVLVLLIIIF